MSIQAAATEVSSVGHNQYRPFVKPVAGYIGALIEGIDLRDDLDAAAVATINDALLRYKVIFFRNQDIGHAEQVAFSKRFGEVTPSHPYDDEPLADHPEILAIDSAKYERRFGRQVFSYEQRWHTDVTALVNPPKASILRAEAVPEQGGDTSWTNLVAAYEGLPEPLKALASSLRAEHRFGGRHPFWEEDSEYGDKVRKNPLVSEHSVVRVHPETGEKALFVTPGFTSRILGVTPDQSDRLLDLFFAEVGNPAYTVRFRWEPGSIAFWDNRATAHLAPPDLGGYTGRRLLYRTTLVGDVPVGPDGQSSRSVRGKAFYAVQ